MKTLMLILTASVTLMTATSHAGTHHNGDVLPCGAIYRDKAVSLSNNRGVLNSSNFAAAQRHSPSSGGQAGAVQTVD